MLGVGERTLVRWESGETPYFLVAMGLLQEVTGKPISWFFDEKGPPHE
jgi:transcriptional regulator with XRE-family HTH domain